MYEKYLDTIIKSIKEIKENENKKILSAVKILKDVTLNKGIIYVFGTGHSHIFAEEIFYRPGGLPNIYPIFYEPIMVHKGPLKSSLLERGEGYINEFIGDYPISNKDAIIIISNSGINPVPIELAIYAKEKGAKVISISSLNYYETSKVRHSAGKFLLDYADVFVNNHIVVGDVVLKNPKSDIKFGSLSTIIGCSIINSITAETIDQIICDTGEAEIFISGNMPGGTEHNKVLVKKYAKKIKALK